MKVVNIRLDPYDVYIGRPGRGGSGEWGNPIQVGKICQACGELHSGGGSTIPCYQRYLHKRLQDPHFRARLLTLEGKVLGCFCAPKGGLGPDDQPFRCHGQVMLRAIRWLKEQ